MAWSEVTLLVDARWVVGLSDALMRNGALSVDVSDANAGSELESPVFSEPGAEVDLAFGLNRVVALFDPSEPAVELVGIACREVGLPAVPDIRLAEVSDQDWVRLNQSQFQPIHASRRLWIVPTWHDPPDPTALNIQLDPGLAFGTGSHATTRLCLDWLDANLKPGDSVIDYGCGSGILAIAAAKLGAGRDSGVDIDPAAIQASIHNAVTNAVSAVFQDARGALLEPADVVVCNILSNPLKILAPLLAGLVRPGGSIVLSGILEPQAAEVGRAYVPWFEMMPPEAEEGWVRLSGIRRHPPQ